MFLFEYSRDWADLVVTQLAARHQTIEPKHWSYACLCIGRRFDPILAEHYLEIDEILGPYLHVFSLLPPPREFIAQRFQEVRERSDALSRRAKYLYESFLTGNRSDLPNRGKMIREKVKLLADLRDAGLQADQYADFLFFAFHLDGRDVDIDVIAAATAPLPDDARPNVFLDLFASMAKTAEKHYRANHSVKAFVDDLSLRWTVQIDIRKASDLYGYIRRFIDIVRGQSG